MSLGKGRGTSSYKHHLLLLQSRYYNQPQMVQLRNGSWLAVLTNAGYTEGEPNQRVISRLHPSPDLSTPGWNEDVNIENHAWGPSAGWVVPLYVPELDRVYAIYTYNEGNITTMPGNASDPCRHGVDFCRRQAFSSRGVIGGALVLR
jgi:hypothetical protein